MDSSSSTSSFENIRPLPLWIVFVILVTVLAASEYLVRANFHPPGDIKSRIANYLATSHNSQEVLVMGSCLPEQIIDIPKLDQSLGGDYSFHVLSTPTGTGLLWHVLLEEYIPESAPVAAVLIPFGHNDLTRRNMPWESQLMEVATWNSLPTLMELDCETFDCKAEIFLSKLSRAYRHRGFLAAQLWKYLGTGRLEKTSRDAQYIKHWQTVRAERNNPYLYLERVLLLAQKRGIQLIFTPLPLRRQSEKNFVLPRPEQQENAKRDALIRQYGGKIFPFPEVPQLRPNHFEDDVHVNQEGRRLLTEALEIAFPQWLQTPQEAASH